MNFRILGVRKCNYIILDLQLICGYLNRDDSFLVEIVNSFWCLVAFELLLVFIKNNMKLMTVESAVCTFLKKIHAVICIQPYPLRSSTIFTAQKVMVPSSFLDGAPWMHGHCGLSPEQPSCYHAWRWRTNQRVCQWSLSISARCGVCGDRRMTFCFQKVRLPASLAVQRKQRIHLV